MEDKAARALEATLSREVLSGCAVRAAIQEERVEKVAGAIERDGMKRTRPKVWEDEQRRQFAEESVLVRSVINHTLTAAAKAVCGPCRANDIPVDEFHTTSFSNGEACKSYCFATPIYKLMVPA